MELTEEGKNKQKIWILLIIGIILRWSVSFFDYSGLSKAPMFGDYEAQRHWMEITYNLPMKEWYVNSTDNDLNYWGLDYPPLTAYHSLLCAYFANIINPSYIQLNISRGFESNEHKLFMRSTVLVSDLLTYMLAACLICKLTSSQFKLAIVLLIYPGIILIDHGHFQYNCVSIGLALLSYTAFIHNFDIIGSIFFCLALNFKQMALYYSLPIFFYLLGKCFKLGRYQGFIHLIKLALTVILTFLILWWPFIYMPKLVFNRLFPIERGLFEDKVSNIWCFINVFIKIRNYFNNNQLALLCAIITFIAVIPSCLDLFINPNQQKKLTLTLINSSLAFFLFSYHVHEKTIIFVSLPVILHYSHEPVTTVWFLVITSISMLPLIIKDSLIIPFLSLNTIFVITCCFIINNNTTGIKLNYKLFSKSFLLLISSLSSIVMIIICIFAPVPHKYPDIYPLIISIYSAIHFTGFFIYFNWLQLIKIKSN